MEEALVSSSKQASSHKLKEWIYLLRNRHRVEETVVSAMLQPCLGINLIIRWLLMIANSITSTGSIRLSLCSIVTLIERLPTINKKMMVEILQSMVTMKKTKLHKIKRGTQLRDKEPNQLFSKLKGKWEEILLISFLFILSFSNTI